ncbi:MAG: CRISPR-associated protein Cas4 [Chloroflexota bacterium]
MDHYDYLPISALNALEYCRRRFYYEHVLGEMVINEHVFEGILKHAVSSAGERRWDEEGLILRRVYVFSDELRLSGFADVVQVSSGENAQLIPVEYKKGRMGRWLNDHIQLCAQALCLEERTGTPVSDGLIFYFGSRRRLRVALTAELREKTKRAVTTAHHLRQSSVIPQPIENVNKCRDCSLEPMCLPQEVKRLNSSAVTVSGP